MVLKKEDVLKKLPELEPYYVSVDEWINKGDNLIVDPNGEVLTSSLNAKEGILLEEVDLHMLRASKWNLDIAGHYVRPDALELRVPRA